MSNDQFDKLFRYVEDMRSEMNTRFDDVNVKFDEVYNRFDGLAKLITDYHQELLMLSRKVDRLERWIHEIAEKTGVKLSTAD